MSQIAKKFVICTTAENLRIKGAGTKMHNCLVGKMSGVIYSIPLIKGRKD
jgi:hypothetical protein